MPLPLQIRGYQTENYLCHAFGCLDNNILEHARINLGYLGLQLHLLNQVLATDCYQVADALELVSVFMAIFGIHILPWIYFNLKLIATSLKRTGHDRGHHLGIGVLVGLIFDVDVFGLGAFANTIPVLPVLRTILGNVDAKENFSTLRVLALFFAQFLATSRFW